MQSWEQMPTNNARLPNWLDNLRRLKGFASDGGHGHGLDHYLSPQQPNDHLHPSINTSPLSGTTPLPPTLPENDVSARMANMLFDLFSDSRGAQISNSKAPRKQPSPKICITPILEDKGSNENGVAQAKSKKLRHDLEEKKPKFDNSDLVGFSRTEVTIIDSSCPSWKFDKYLFRKKNVWKARDRKGLLKSSKSEALDRGIVRKKSKTFGSRKQGSHQH